MSTRTYDYVGIGGGGGGGGKFGQGNDGTTGSLHVANAVLTVNKSLLIGGAGGGGSSSASGGKGGNGDLMLSNAGLFVADTLLVGGRSGGAAGSIGTGGTGGTGRLTILAFSSVKFGLAGGLTLGGGAGGGAGLLDLAGGVADFSGGAIFTINTNGTLNVGGNSSTSTAAGTISNLSTLTNNGIINFNQRGPGAYVLDVDVSGTGSVSVNTQNTTVLNGNNLYTGGTTVSAGTLQIGNGGVSGFIAGDIVNRSAVVFNRSDDSSYAGTMSGPGRLSKIGAGTLRWTGIGDAMGQIHITEGALVLTGPSARFGTVSPTVIGSSGNASLVVSAGAAMSASDVSTAQGMRGTVIVNGAGSSMTSRQFALGDGELRVLDGGRLTTTRAIVDQTTGVGALITGIDSLWTIENELILSGGSPGIGTVIVENGGTVRATEINIGGTIIARGNGIDGRGTLTFDSIIRSPAAIRVSINFDGGILRPGTSQTQFLPRFNAGEITLGAGGLYFDTDGRNVGVSAPLGGVGKLNKIGAGRLTLSGANTYSGSTTVERGTLALDAPHVLGGGPMHVASQATLNLAGHAQTVAGLSGSGNVQLGAATLAIDAAHASTAFSGVVSGPGGLLKQGAGTLTLSGTNTYSGTTQIDAGRLVIDGSIASSTVKVGSGAQLAGVGTVGSTTVASGGVLAPGNGLGHLRVAGNLDLASGAILDYDLGAKGTSSAAAGTSDHIQVDGNLRLDGTLALRDVEGTAGIGYYRLLSYGGSLSGQGLKVGTLPQTLASDEVRVVSDAAGHIDLRVGRIGSNLLQTWAGGNGIWNAGNSNWVNDGGTWPQTWAGNNAVFMTTGGAKVSVQGIQPFTSLQFVADGYHLNGGGTLQTRANDSELRVLGGATATIDTTISGVGGINKTQGGTLVLNGANTYAGGTTISAGVLSVSRDANLGGAMADLTLNGGTLRIANAAFRQTPRALTLGTAGGTLETGNDFTMLGAISGAGAFNKAGAGTLTLASDSTRYAGLLTVTAGTLGLADNARLGGSLWVAPGAQLSGAGTLGSATIARGAIHSPGGDGIGTQTFTGNYVNHGTLRIDVTQTAHDSVVVAGDVDLTGTTLDLRLTPADASFQNVMRPYMLISKQSAGNAEGAFSAVNNPLLFLDVAINTLGGDGNDVTLTLNRNNRNLAGAAQTSNQLAVAGVIDTLPQSHQVWRNAILSHNTSQLEQALDQLSGDMHASVSSGLMNATSLATQTAMAHLRGNLTASILQDEAAVPRPDVYPMWAQMTGNWQRQDGDGNAPGIDQNSTGIALGGDVELQHGWRVGGAFGYTDARMRLQQRPANAKVQSYTTTIYGGKAFAAGSGAVNVTAGIAYTWHDIDTQRQIQYGSMDQKLTAGHGANTTQLFAEIGYATPVTSSITLEPFIGAARSDLRVRGFSESGGSAALSAHSQKQVNTSTLTGLRGQWAPSQSAVVLRGMLGWRHAYGSLRPTKTLAFDQGASFSVTGTPIARDAARLELGADLVVARNITAGLSYAGELGGGNRQHAGTLDVRWRF